MTKGQQKDLESILYFMPNQYKDIKITELDIQQFFDLSERGKKRGDEQTTLAVMDGYHALLEGKRWRGIHMEMYEEGVMDGSMPYFALLAEMSLLTGWRKLFARILGRETFRLEMIPESVMDFMAKTMFKGIDDDRIRKLYSEMKSSPESL